ncbi:MAG: TolC family protein [Candidatus Latescibacterota bacterium]
MPRIPETSARLIDTKIKAEENALPHPSSAITLRDAVSLTMRHNPALAAAAWETSAQEAGIGQAGLRLNPEIELSSEEFGGTAARQRFGGAEMSLRLSQVIELGGKRAQRKQTASLDHALAQWDFEIKRLDTLTQVTQSFIELLAAQERLSLVQKSEKLAEQFHDVVHEKVKAGKVPPLEESRAQVALATARLKRQQAERTLQTARKQTASFWGESNPTFEFASGNLDSILPVPRTDNPDQLISKNPELNRWTVEMERRSAAFDLERANRVPDIAISGGVSRFNADRETALVMGLSIPFPVFNRNQGNVQKAERQLAKAREEQRAEAVRVRKNLFAQYQTLAAAYEQASTLALEVIPVAQSAFSVAEEGYRAGKFSYLEVLDAQRALFEVQEQNIEALAAYHSATAEMERLTGASLEEIIPKNR